MADPSRLYAEHPQDVLNQWLDWRQVGPVALVVITSTEGGSVRSPGALMAVAGDGRRCGYISGGCVDADVVLQAQQALKDNQTLSLRYGAGSPFIDMPLPCGGAIEITILPSPDEALLRQCHDKLRARKWARLSLPELPASFVYHPKLRIRIAGRGADALALARLVRAGGYDLALQLRDGEDIDEALHDGFEDVVALKTPQDLPPGSDDAYTAFILMFHDPDWEAALLKQALCGKAFYIGAVGSQKTQARRRARLAQEGIAPEQIARIRGPIGLVPSMRDASMLAVSALAEIVGAYRETQVNPYSNTAVILLAAGQSERFQEGDKLLADLAGRPVLTHTAARLAEQPVAARIAVTGPGQADRQKILKSAGWQIIENKDAAAGQSTSLKAGMDAVMGMPDVEQVLVLLADMPFISDKHLHSLRETMTPETSAVMSVNRDTLCPPAIFSEATFGQLAGISGDVGARHIFRSLNLTRTCQLPDSEALDIDTTEDLARATGALPA
ncbi:NTP transferase domain-containing protein [uncultured Hyphomonas sp.]|uniref:NTP transferase domain-containing protein n=1 Tax=uncultured Hyphomonas sp. TaxID=225298 RepID=UPI002AABFD76|nr:NTP transferase domain-containing protein [uncultured Hyphomonas sp.]